MKLLTVAQAADLLALQPGTVRILIRKGRLPAVRPTGTKALRIPEDAVEALIRGAKKPV